MGESNPTQSSCFISFPCVRALLMLFNIVFWVSGLMLTYIGVWMRTDFELFLKINKNYSELAPYVVLIIGLIVLFVASLACTCIVKVQPTLLVIYGGFLITMLYTLISLSVYVYTYKDRLIAGIETGLGQEMKNHELYSSDGQNFTMLDAVQKKLNCCGNDNYLNWQRNILPNSCCSDRNECNVNSSSLFRVGCSQKLHQVIKTNLATVGAATSVIALFPLLGTVFSFALAILGGNKSGYERIA